MISLISAVPKDDSDPRLSAFLSPHKVLRFYAIWDDTNCAFGDHHPCVIHYFLADDTVEVREVHKRNDGRDPFPVLMRRQRLPKVFVDKNSKFRLAHPSVLRCYYFMVRKKFFKWSLNSLSFGKQWQHSSVTSPCNYLYTLLLYLVSLGNVNISLINLFFPSAPLSLRELPKLCTGDH